MASSSATYKEEPIKKLVKNPDRSKPVYTPKSILSPKVKIYTHVSQIGTVLQWKIILTILKLCKVGDSGK